MHLADIILDHDALLALEPSELGLAILPVIQAFLRGRSDLLGENDFLKKTVGAYGEQQRDDVREAIREAWAWLIGQGLLIVDERYIRPHDYVVLSRSAKLLVSRGDPRRLFARRKIPKEHLHPAMRAAVWPLYHRGEYELAIVAAMRSVEVEVRRAASFAETDHGAPMVGKAFNAKTGPLRDQSASPAEQEAMAGFMSGAFGLYRNPYAHREMGQDDPDEAAEIILLASHMLRLVTVALARQGGDPPEFDD